VVEALMEDVQIERRADGTEVRMTRRIGRENG
jgi:hypothetical protein